jgi:putative membrane protein insertion efficiency factor
MRSVATLFVRAYQRWVSPLLPRSCRFVPSCSEYALEAIDRYGVLTGGMLAGWRLLRCQPFSHGGFDPVPQEIFHQHSNMCKR